jgi:hypothetical protein
LGFSGVKEDLLVVEAVFADSHRNPAVGEIDLSRNQVSAEWPSAGVSVLAVGVEADDHSVRRKAHV